MHFVGRLTPDALWLSAGELLAPYQESGLNTYDVRKKCEIPGLCYNFSAPSAWLNLDSTRKALGVTKASAKWASCNYVVNAQFSSDWMAEQQCTFREPFVCSYWISLILYSVDTVPPLLAAGVDVLIYAGDADFVCNWIGNKAWTIG